MRCMHEAACHRENCFLTLTYDDAHLPSGGVLSKRDVVLFFKRLRKDVAPQLVRYFVCGEYGSVGFRPHYHVLLFGFSFPDRVRWSSRGGFPVWRSAQLERLWSFGLSEIGEVSFESASYVARYLVKAGKRTVLDRSTGEVASEFAQMSRRPGLGREWIERYRDEVYPADRVISRGEPSRPPRYYDKYLESVDPDCAVDVKRRRCEDHVSDDDSPERLEVLEKVLVSRLSTSSRRLE